MFSDQIENRDAPHLEKKNKGNIGPIVVKIKFFKMITVKNNIPINIFDILNVFTLTLHVDEWSNSRPNKTKLEKTAEKKGVKI